MANPFDPDSIAARAYDSGHPWAIALAQTQNAVNAEWAQRQAAHREAVTDDAAQIAATKRTLIAMHPEMPDHLIDQTARRMHNVQVQADAQVEIAALDAEFQAASAAEAAERAAVMDRVSAAQEETYAQRQERVAAQMAALPNFADDVAAQREAAGLNTPD